MMRVAYFAAFVAIFATGCQNEGRQTFGAGSAPEVVMASSRYMKPVGLMACRGFNFTRQDTLDSGRIFFASADQRFWHEHRAERRRTCEVVDSVDRGYYGVVFTRFTIGTDVFRDATYLRKYNREWMQDGNQYYNYYESPYGGSADMQDPFGDGDKNNAKNLIKRVNDWKGESPSINDIIRRGVIPDTSKQ